VIKNNLNLSDIVTYPHKALKLMHYLFYQVYIRLLLISNVATFIKYVIDMFCLSVFVYNYCNYSLA